MIAELIVYGGGGSLAVPFGYMCMQLRNTRLLIKAGIKAHIFEPYIRRDMHGKHVMKWCDVCGKRANSWIHTNRKSSDAAEGNYLDRTKIFRLEIEETKWRFANDPEWVQVFGHEFDPETFERIPQFHNGECGGALDSCERCNWEYDQKKFTEEAEHRAFLAEKAKEERLFAQEVEETVERTVHTYLVFLWTIWNTVHEVEQATVEFVDLGDEIGLLENDSVRKRIKNSDVFLRLRYCLASDERWPRREEVWQDKRRQDKKERDRRNRYPYH